MLSVQMFSFVFLQYSFEFWCLQNNLVAANIFHARDRGSMRQLHPPILLLLLLALVTGDITPCRGIIRPDLLARLDNVDKSTFAAYLENFSKLLATYYDSQLYYYYGDLPLKSKQTHISMDSPKVMVDLAIAKESRNDQTDSRTSILTRRSTRLLSLKNATFTVLTNDLTNAPPSLSTGSAAESSKSSATSAASNPNRPVPVEYFLSLASTTRMHDCIWHVAKKFVTRVNKVKDTPTLNFAWLSNFESGPVIGYIFRQAIKSQMQLNQMLNDDLLYQTFVEMLRSYPKQVSKQIEHFEDIEEKIEQVLPVTVKSVQAHNNCDSPVDEEFVGHVFDEQLHSIQAIADAFDSNWKHLPPDRVRHFVYRHYTVNAAVQNAPDWSLNSFHFPSMWSEDSVTQYTTWMHYHDLKTYTSDTLEQIYICKANGSLECVAKLKEIVAAHPNLVGLKTSELLTLYLENKCDKLMLLLIYICVSAWQKSISLYLYKHTTWYLSHLRKQSIQRLFALYANDNDLESHLKDTASATSTELKSDPKFTSRIEGVKLFISYQHTKTATPTKLYYRANNLDGKHSTCLDQSLGKTEPIKLTGIATDTTLNLFHLTDSYGSNGVSDMQMSLPYTRRSHSANTMDTAHVDDSLPTIEKESDYKLAQKSKKRKDPPNPLSDEDTCYTSTQSSKRLQQTVEQPQYKDDHSPSMIYDGQHQAECFSDSDSDDDYPIEILKAKPCEPVTVDYNDMQTPASSDEECDIDILSYEE